MITESDIEKFINSMENRPENSLDYPLEFEEYLDAEIYPNLTRDEADTLHFCLSVIHGSLSQADESIPFSIEEYLDAEEQNWAGRDKNTPFITSLDGFFSGYPEEDLLAFVEDMIVDDEDQQLSQAGQEIIFITAKSYIDQQKSLKN